jgi:hypothetical protein
MTQDCPHLHPQRSPHPGSTPSGPEIHSLAPSNTTSQGHNTKFQSRKTTRPFKFPGLPQHRDSPAPRSSASGMCPAIHRTAHRPCACSAGAPTEDETPTIREPRGRSSRSRRRDPAACPARFPSPRLHRAFHPAPHHVRIDPFKRMDEFNSRWFPSRPLILLFFSIFSRVWILGHRHQPARFVFETRGL